jgi:Arc/MetJ-type ribon-helix-helix transcriptional regulator
MSNKQRLSASVDAELIEAAEAAVAGGRFESVSAWVNEALRLKLEQDRRLEALATFVAAYEAEHGEITAAEMRLAARRARARAVVVRPMPTPSRGTTPAKRRAAAARAR